MGELTVNQNNQVDWEGLNSKETFLITGSTSAATSVLSEVFKGKVIDLGFLIRSVEKRFGFKDSNLGRISEMRISHGVGKSAIVSSFLFSAVFAYDLYKNFGSIMDKLVDTISDNDRISNGLSFGYYSGLSYVNAIPDIFICALPAGLISLFAPVFTSRIQNPFLKAASLLIEPALSSLASYTLQEARYSLFNKNLFNT